MSRTIRSKTPSPSTPSDNSGVEPLAVTIANARELTGLGRTKLYEMMAANEIKSVFVGGRRLILFSSLRALFGGV